MSIRPNTWRIFDPTLGAFSTRHLAKKLCWRFCKCFSKNLPRPERARQICLLPCHPVRMLFLIVLLLFVMGRFNFFMGRTAFCHGSFCFVHGAFQCRSWGIIAHSIATLPFQDSSPIALVLLPSRLGIAALPPPPCSPPRKLPKALY